MKDELKDKLTEPQVVDRLENIICQKNSPWNWNNSAHQYALLKEHLPLHLKHRRTKIIKEVESAYNGWLFANPKEIDNRFLVVINGDSGTRKTNLAYLICKRLAEKEIIIRSDNYTIWEEQDLSDKLDRLWGSEVVILDDYSGENHKLGVLNKLTGKDKKSKIRVMGNYEATQYIKGVIIPTVDSIETWITKKTGTLRKFIQILRRTNCTLYIFEPKHVANSTWEDYKGLIFYVGDVRQWVYDSIIENCPQLLDEPLWANNRDTQLAKDLAKLYHIVMNDLYKDKSYWGDFYTTDKVKSQFHAHQLPTDLWTQPNIIRTFKIPTYEWLREKVSFLSNEQLYLPKKYETETAHHNLPVNSTITPILDKETSIAIDIETVAWQDSPLKKLNLKSIQLNDQFIKVIPQILPVLKQSMKGKTFKAFNSSFEQIQLERHNFNVWANDWYDVQLMAKLYDNRLSEENIDSLASMEEHFASYHKKERFSRKT